MFGGSNTNSFVPVFLDENLLNYPSNQLQLFGNGEYLLSVVVWAFVRLVVNLVEFFFSLKKGG